MKRRPRRISGRMTRPRGVGVGVDPARCDQIHWTQIAGEISELKRIYTGLPLPGKPKVAKRCMWALETALGKYEEAETYRERGECELAGEFGLDAIRYHGIFLHCQMNQPKAKKKKPKKRKTRKKKR